MPKSGKKPCSICRRWFRPNPRVGQRQRACTQPECQAALRRKTQANWRARNPDYAIAWRLGQRASQTPPPEPLRMPPPLHQLPWDVAKDEFRPQGADFLAFLARLLRRAAKDEIRSYLADSKSLPGTLPLSAEKTRSAPPHTETRASPDATGVSPTGPPLGAPASARAAPPAAPAGLSG